MQDSANNITQLTPLHKWDDISSNWNLAVKTSEQIDPLSCTTAWQLSFYESFEPDRPLFIRESPGNIVAFAEYQPPSGQVFLTPIDLMWQFCNPLLGAEAIEMFIDCLPEIASQYDGQVPHLLFSGLSPTSPFFKKLTQSLGNKFHFYRYHQEILCNASLDGGFDGYLSRRSPTLRRNLIKQINRAVRQGIVFERCSPERHNADEIFKRMIEVELASWKGIDHCGMAEQPQKSFYLHLLQRLARSGDTRVIFARHDDQDIGYIFGGIFQNIYRGQQFSFVEDWRKSSIGNLLQVEQIKWLCEEGCDRYDMGPIMDYKDHWAEQRSTIQSWMAVEI